MFFSIGEFRRHYVVMYKEPVANHEQRQVANYYSIRGLFEYLFVKVYLTRFERLK
jgi:hypothetical protein